MSTEPRPVKDIFLNALVRPANERAAFLDRELGADTPQNVRVRQLLDSLESVETSARESDGPSLPIAGRAKSNVRHQWIIVGLLLGVIFLGAAIVSYRFWERGERARENYLRLIDQNSETRAWEIRKNREQTELWGANSYRHLADFHADLFAVGDGDVWKPAAPEQLEAVRILVRTYNPERKKNTFDPKDDSRLAVCYFAAWNWGVGEGFYRLKDYYKAVGYLKTAMEFAEIGFGSADAVTLSIRTTLALAYHRLDLDEEAAKIVVDGDLGCRKAVAADPALLDIRNGKAINESWGKLISISVVLPTVLEGKHADELLWQRRIDICLLHPDHVTTNYRPHFDDGYQSYLMLLRSQKENRPSEVEQIHRKHLARSTQDAKKNPAVWNDRESVMIKLAQVLFQKPSNRFPDAEELLLGAIQSLEPQYRGKPKQLTPSGKDPLLVAATRRYTVEPWDRVYGDAVRGLIDLYGEWDRKEDAAKWRTAYAEYLQAMKKKYPGARFPE